MPPAQSSEWETPQALFDELDSEFGFTLDPCATAENAKCERYFTEALDGMEQSWDDEVVFVNPPYGRGVADWIRKAWLARATVVVLLPARTDVRWFHDLVYGKAEIRFLKGRLTFGGAPAPAPFPSMVVVFRETPEMKVARVKELMRESIDRTDPKLTSHKVRKWIEGLP